MPAIRVATERINGVQLMRVGTWDASTGRTSITRAHLAAAIQAHADKLIDWAPIKIGHDDDRFQSADSSSARDGTPAYGWLENLRLADGGDTLVGDLVGIPKKLAQIMPAAFRRRSVEIAFKLRSAAGKVYDAAITGLALLGREAPAVKGLDDIAALYTAAGQPAFGGITAVYFADNDTPNIPHAPAGSTDADRHDDKPNPEGLVKIDPKLKDALGLAEDASDEDVKKALAKSGLTLIDGGKPDDASGEGKTGADGAAKTATGTGQAAGAAQTTGDAGNTAAGGATTATPTPTATAADAQPQTVAASAAPAGDQSVTITVDRAAFSALQASAKDGQEARAQQIAERRDAKITAALSAGKIPAAATAEYRKMLDSDEAAATALLAALPQVLPVTEIGFSAPTDTQVKATQADDKRAVATFIGMGE